MNLSSRSIDLSFHGIHGGGAEIHYNLSPSALYQVALNRGACISDRGALVVSSGERTGRSPADKRVVRDPKSEADIWWGDVNVSIERKSFDRIKKIALDLLSKQVLYILDGFAGDDPKHRVKVRIICTEPYHALFMQNMLIRLTEEEEKSFGEPDYVIYNAGNFSLDETIEGCRNTHISICFESREMVIFGTLYAGEMKKGIFTIFNYIMPKQEVLSMHCSANEGDSGVTLFFGLSGTGKTTLSADSKRKLIGDDEHGWSDDGIFNIEGGCYAKCIDLSEEKEPDIFSAIRFGTVLENVTLERRTHRPLYRDRSVTENTRAAYPINFISNAKHPSRGEAPKNIIFLTCDAFGVLPPVSNLSLEQVYYHFISGYTAKVAGTEVGIDKPQVSFSACFGAPFLVFHPVRYAKLLIQKIEETNSTAWLVNTGWSGDPRGKTERIKLEYSRAIIDAIHSGDLARADTQISDIFNLVIPTSCLGVPDEILNPRNVWQDKERYDQQRIKLANLFIDNFKKFESEVDSKVIKAGPLLPK